MNWIREELDKISEGEIQSPVSEIRRGDVVIGNLESVEVRKIHELRQRVARDIERLLKDAEKTVEEARSSGDHNLATCERCKVRRQLQLLDSKREIIDSLFWSCLRHELSEEALIKSEEMGIGSVDIRKGWQIVLPTQDNPFNGLFADILGLNAVFQS